MALQLTGEDRKKQIEKLNADVARYTEHVERGVPKNLGCTQIHRMLGV